MLIRCNDAGRTGIARNNGCVEDIYPGGILVACRLLTMVCRQTSEMKARKKESKGGILF